MLGMVQTEQELSVEVQEKSHPKVSRATTGKYKEKECRGEEKSLSPGS